MSKTDADEPFLSRWSRRKRDAVQQPTPGAEVASQQLDANPGSTARAEGEQAAAAKPDAEPLDLTRLPRIEDLLPTSDITAFLDTRVPAALRNAALSRMWTLDPAIRDFIEVAEYQWNWNVPGGAPFYEEMLPGSGPGTLIADATSAISRSLGSVPAAEPSPASIAESNSDNLPNRDELSTQHAALHDNPIADNDANAADAEKEPGVNPTFGGVEPTAPAEPSGFAATQQEPVKVPLPRRRHGSALPA